MNTIFIRHKLGCSDEILEELRVSRLIAVHYADIDSADPEKYGRAGRIALTRLRECCRTGAIVGATYPTRPADMIVGEIEPGSTIEPKQYGEHWYKVVQLGNVLEVSYRHYPVLAAIQPRLGTVTGWPAAADILQAIVRQKPLDRSVQSLAPCQLEVICYEYLRAEKTLSALVLPIGGTMRDVDIWGIDENGERVVAQVTQTNDPTTIKSKMDALREHQGEGTKLIFFGPESCRVQDPDVRYVAVEDVFESMSGAEGEAIHRKLIDVMLMRDPKAVPQRRTVVE